MDSAKSRLAEFHQKLKVLLSLRDALDTETFTQTKNQIEAEIHTLETGGGAVIAGNVGTSGGDFTGRDRTSIEGDGNTLNITKIINIIQQIEQDTDPLKSYCGKIARLIFEEGLFTSSPEDKVHRDANFYTHNIVKTLTGPDKGKLLKFLHEAGLINLGNSIISLEGAYFSHTYYPGGDLHSADLHGIKIEYADLHGANLENVNLENANLKGVNLSAAYLRGARLGNAHLSSRYFTTNLSGADLESVTLTKANLCEVNLCEANLSGAKLQSANLQFANLQSANLEGAYYDYHTVWPTGFIPHGAILANSQDRHNHK